MLIGYDENEQQIKDIILELPDEVLLSSCKILFCATWKTYGSKSYESFQTTVLLVGEFIWQAGI
jgi:hypothetical protein